MKLDMRHPDIMRRTSGGGLLILFGLPFFAAGLFVIGASLSLWAQKGNSPPWYVGVPFGGVFAAVGATLMFGRSGIAINKMDRTLVKWWGLLGPFRRKEYSLDDFDRVHLTREVRRSKNSSYTVYPVRVAGPDERVTVEEPRDYEKARRIAEEVAGFLGTKLVDGAAGTEVVRQAGELDESLRERTQRAGDVVTMPDPPPFLRTRCTIEGRSVILDLPSAGLGIGHVVGLIAGVVFPVIVALLILRPIWQEDMPRPAKYMIMGFLGVVFVLLPFLAAVGAALSQARSSVRITASPERLSVERRGLLFNKTRAIPADDLEELILPGNGEGEAARNALEKSNLPDGVKAFLGTLVKPQRRGLLARSDAATLEFGNELPDAELRWIHAVILRIMTA